MSVERARRMPFLELWTTRVLTLSTLAVGCGNTTASVPDATAHDATAVRPDAGTGDGGHPTEAGSNDAAKPTKDAAKPSKDAAVIVTTVDVLTQHNDMARTGQNLHETALSPSNVGSVTFGKLFSLKVHGFLYAQPLIVSQYAVGGKTRNIVIVATAHNEVDAFDADTGGDALWTTNLGPSVPSSAIHNGQGTPNIQVEVGIISTPVIDRANGLIYVSNKTYVNDTQGLALHALDLATGVDVAGSPVAITATALGVGDGGVADELTLTPEHHLQRAALLLLNGTVYLAFASHGDWTPYYGWVLGYRYDKTAQQLTQTAVFNTSTDGAQAGIWQSGQGPSSDGTDIYLATGNGIMTVGTGGTSYGEAFLRLSPSLAVLDWFVPTTWETLNQGDFDLGAGGTLLVPDTQPPILVGGGKQGIVYLADTTSLGHLGTTSDKVLQEFAATTRIFSSPAAWTGGGGTRIYLWGAGDVLREFRMSGRMLGTAAVATAAPGTATVMDVQDDATGNVSISSNGSVAGTGIVWGAAPLMDPNLMTVTGILYAFDALTLTELWDSRQVPARDDFGNYAKFVAPTVANGKVYVATDSQAVAVYGLLP